MHLYFINYSERPKAQLSYAVCQEPAGKKIKEKHDSSIEEHCVECIASLPYYKAYAVLSYMLNYG